MLNKYKVSEVAKDFGLKSKDIIDLLAKYFEGEKKHSSALEEDELDIVFETFTLAKQVDEEGLKAYFDMASEKKPEEKEQGKAEEKTEAPAEENTEEAPADETKSEAYNFYCRKGKILSENSGYMISVLNEGRYDKLEENIMAVVKAKIRQRIEAAKTKLRTEAFNKKFGE